MACFLRNHLARGTRGIQMSFEKFLHRNRLMAQCLEQIVASGMAGRLFECPAAADPSVRQFVAAQQRLLTAAERLLDHCESARA